MKSRILFPFGLLITAAICQAQDPDFARQLHRRLVFDNQLISRRGTRRRDSANSLSAHPPRWNNGNRRGHNP